MNPAERIRQLEIDLASQTDKVIVLEEKVENLQNLQNYLMGVSDAAKWGFKLIVALAGVGGLAAIYKIIQWLQAPMPPLK